MPRLINRQNKVHCLFEQSGTFRDAFRSLGFQSWDYDILDDFGKTDCRIDLLDAISRAYHGRPSLFDRFCQGDLLMAFFPCTYFNQNNRLMLTLSNSHYASLPLTTRFRKIIARSRKIQLYYERLNQLACLAHTRNLKLVVENPCTGSLIHSTFYKPPLVIDSNRAEMGDYFRKPTMYFFVNCEPASTIVNGGYKCAPFKKRIETSARGISRSLISSEYALNWIRAYVLGIPPKKIQLTLDMF